MIHDQAAEIAALKIQNQAIQTALERNECETAKIKKEMSSFDVDVSGNDMKQQMLISASTHNVRPRGYYDLTFQGEERLRGLEREQAAQRDRLGQYEEGLTAQAEQLTKKSNSSSKKCVIQ
jgi:hypothetical protein